MFGFFCRELEGSPLGPWSLSSALMPIGYPHYCKCWSMYYTCRLQKTFTLEVTYLVAIETDTHVLFAVLGIMPFLPTFVSPMSYSTRTILKLPIHVEIASLLTSKTWIDRFEFLGCGQRWSQSLPLIPCVGLQLHFFPPSMLLHLS